MRGGGRSELLDTLIVYEWKTLFGPFAEEEALVARLASEAPEVASALAAGTLPEEGWLERIGELAGGLLSVGTRMPVRTFSVALFVILLGPGLLSMTEVLGALGGK